MPPPRGPSSSPAREWSVSPLGRGPLLIQTLPPVSAVMANCPLPAAESGGQPLKVRKERQHANGRAPSIQTLKRNVAEVFDRDVLAFYQAVDQHIYRWQTMVG